MADANNLHASRIASMNARRKKRTQRFFVFFLVLIVFVFAVIMYVKFFDIRKIEITGIENGVYSQEKIIEVLGVDMGDNLINVRRSAKEELLEREFAYVKKANVKKSFPTTLKIELELHSPSMAVVLGDSYFYLSSAGKVLGSADAENPLPDGVCRINVPFIKECIDGEKILLEDEETLEMLLDIYSGFEKNGLSDELTYLDVTDKFDISASLDDRFEIIFGTFEDADAKTSLLAAVMTGDVWLDSSGIIDISDSREAAVRLTGSAAG